MQITDAQIHLWGQGLPSNQAHIQETSFSTERALALMDQAGVDAAVIHPPGWDPDSEALAKQAVKDHPGRFAILASPPVEDPALRQRLPTLRAEPGMLGLRYLFIEEP